jgi:hypothetical protein
MPGGSGGSGGSGREPGELPGLAQPPAYKEGLGGGPVFPAGPPLSAADKELFDELSDISVYMAGLSAVLAAGLGLAGQGIASFMAAAGAAIWSLDAQLFSDLADDPPQPAFRRIAEFRPRAFAPPGAGDPVLAPLGVAAQRGLFLTVTGRGYLDAAERLLGAQAAHDLDWALAHAGVLDPARWALAVDLATYAAALAAAGGALAGSPYDVALTPGAGGVKAWIETPQAREAVPRQLRRAGLTAEETDATLAYFRTDPGYDGPAGPVSAELTARGIALHALATRLAA